MMRLEEVIHVLPTARAQAGPGAAARVGIRVVALALILSGRRRCHLYHLGLFVHAQMQLSQLVRARGAPQPTFLLLLLLIRGGHCEAAW